MLSYFLRKITMKNLNWFAANQIVYVCLLSKAVSMARSSPLAVYMIVFMITSIGLFLHRMDWSLKSNHLLHCITKVKCLLYQTQAIVFRGPKHHVVILMMQHLGWIVPLTVSTAIAAVIRFWHVTGNTAIMFVYSIELDSFKDAGHLGCRDTCNVLWDGYGVWNEETWEPYTPGRHKQWLHEPKTKRKNI